MKVFSDIKRGAEIIHKGDLVAFPTETVYGLGANAFDPLAVAKIFETKERPSFDPLIVHICDISQLSMLYAGDDERVVKLAERFWPGPLTLVLPKMESVPGIVTSGLDTVAVRMPANQIALKLIELSKTPLAAPSANKFGMISPTDAAHVKKQFPQVFTIDGGRTNVGIESTVITLNEDGFEILRPGFVTSEDLEVVVPRSKQKPAETHLKAPGLLKSHYSPRKPMYIADDPCLKLKEASKGGLISFGIPVEDCPYAKVEVLSKTRDLKEAAINLFNAMHTLDDSDVEYIVAESVPQEGIGIAIMNRLIKAAYPDKSK